MTRARRLVLASLSLLFIASEANAELVTIAFGGEITNAVGSIDGMPSLPFSIGDPIVATITFDSESPDFDSSIGVGSFSGPMAATISVGSLQIDYDFTNTANATVTCNVAAYCPPSALGPLSLFTHEWIIHSDPIAVSNSESSFLVNVVRWFPAEPNAFNLIDQLLELYLEEFLGPPFDPPIPDADLPTAPYDLSGISVRTGTFKWVAPPSSGTTTSYEGTFSLDSMTFVSIAPVDSMSAYSLLALTISLAGLALAGLASAVRKSQL